MQTNKPISRESELGKCGIALLQAAHDYWQEYQVVCGSAAVVWLNADNGHFVLFTRGEYKDDILPRALGLDGEPPLEHPFEPIPAAPP